MHLFNTPFRRGILFVSLFAAAAMLLLSSGCGGGGGSLTTDLADGQLESTVVSDSPVILAAPDNEVPDGVDPEVWRMLSEALAAMLEDLPAERSVANVPSGAAGRVRDLRVSDVEADSFRLEWSFVNAGDYDQNTQVTTSDITLIGQYYEAFEGDANWTQARFADGNHDGAVTVADLTAIGANFGHLVKAYNIYCSDDYLDHPAYNSGVNGSGAVLIETVYSGYTTDNLERAYSSKVTGVYAKQYYWVVPTNGIDEGEASNLAGGELTAWPVIDSIDPHFGMPGTTVTISGSGFGQADDDGTLEFNGVELAVLDWTDELITTQIPEGADDGTFQVRLGFRFADSPEFLVAQLPVVESCDPAQLAFGQPFSIQGTDFLPRQGVGLLFVDGRVHPLADWSDGLIDVEFLNPLRNWCDVANVQVLASNGLMSEPVYFPGDFVMGQVSVDPLVGLPDKYDTDGTEFTFTYEMDDGSDDYTVRLYPDYGRSEIIVEDADDAKAGLQFTYSDATQGCYRSSYSMYETALELTNNVTGQTFIVPGPTVNLNSYFVPDRPVLLSVAPLNFGQTGSRAPNEICYYPEDDTYLDITFIDDVPQFTSALTDLTGSGGETLESYPRDLDEFLVDGGNPRPYCYRHKDALPYALVGSTMSLTGVNLGEEVLPEELRIGSSCLAYTCFTEWTDTEIQFIVPQDPNIYSGLISHEQNSGSYSEDRGVNMICSAVLGSVTGYTLSQVALDDGLITLHGTDILPREIPGITGAGILSVWQVSVSYVSPWTGEVVTTSELLVTPVAPSYHTDKWVHLRTTDLDPDGDGLVLVEARSADGTAAQLLEAELVPGEAAFFLWTGILESGSLLEIAQSGIFSEQFTYELVSQAEPNTPPIADLQVDFESFEAPAQGYLDAYHSYDPDGLVVDYEWDLDGDGIYNENTTYNSYGYEVSRRGFPSFSLSFQEAGTYMIGLRVTDDRGAQTETQVTIEVVDDYGDLEFTAYAANMDQFPDTSDSTFSLYLGSPDTGELVREDIVTHEFDETDSPYYRHRFTLDYTDLPRGEYWLRVSNPDIAWDAEVGYSIPETVGEYYDIGPYMIPETGHDTLYGGVWQ